ncbi:MAG TPA: crotonase/enoyl-CoA hydratase family protein [Pseudonocardia sp.]|nr:crotonase/enoyl-CoA hydratase family protein [Pseudonocardia sp.]
MVEYETRGRVAILTINRPEARNAVNGAVATGMEAGIDRLEADGEVWAGVVAAAGPVFSAGADLKLIASGGFAEMETERGGFGGIVRRERRKPLVAAVDGAALAGGCEIALACDLIVAARDAKFGLPETKRSLVAGAGGLFRLPQRIPRAIAMEYALTGEFFSAEDANTWGLVNRLTDPGEALAGALQLARKITECGPLAVRATKKIVRDGGDWPAEERWARQQEIMGPVMTSADAREGARAFAEKRAPVWTGK